MTDEATPGTAGDRDAAAGPTASAKLDQHQEILAEADALAGLLVDAAYPLLARHTSGGQRAGFVIAVACVVRLADALGANTAAIREQTEVIRQQVAEHRSTPAGR